MKNLSKLEKSWILYDIANSAYVLLASTILPIVFNSVAENALDSATYLAYWGYAVSISTLITAIIGPILGTVSDRKGKMPFFKSFLVSAIVALILLAFVKDYKLFLILFVITRVGFSAANIFYDSMLIDVSPHENRDLVSSYGFAWGYIGSSIPFIASIAIIILAGSFGFNTDIAMIISFIITAIWWIVFSLPLIKNYQQKNYSVGERASGNIVTDTFSELLNTFREIVLDKEVLIFLIAFFFYIDGVSTIINMATAYGTSLGLSTIGLILALLMTQFVAFPTTVFFGRASKRFSPTLLLNICILGYVAIGVLAVFLNTLWQFWVLAFMVGLFQGGIQALSRSHFSKIIPQDKSGRYFGIYDIFGKGASIFGTFTMSFITQITGKQNLGILILVFFFIIGLILYNYSLKFSLNKEKR